MDELKSDFDSLGFDPAGLKGSVVLALDPNMSDDCGDSCTKSCSGGCSSCKPDCKDGGK